MMRKAIGLAVALVLLSLISVAVAQSRRVPSPAIEQIKHALNEGRYDEVRTLAASLDTQEPSIAALVARAAIARGRYDEAQTSLETITRRAPTSDAALEYGLLLAMLGRADATPVLTRVAAVAETSSDPYELSRAARALRALGRAHEANAAYRDAVSMLPRDPAVNTEWGDLFLEKFQKGEAVKSYQEALRQDGKWVPALLGMARALSDEDPPQAIKLAHQALAINPSNVALHVFLAEEAADAGHRDDARASLQKALDVNPSSLDAHALLGALAYVEDRTAEFDAEIAKTLAINPGYGEAYRVAAELASHNFRYEDAAVLAKRAVELDANNPRILADLGTHLLRTGEEADARKMLEASFKLDDFDVVTKNLLDMMDKLDQFVTIRDGDLIVRMDKNEAPVLGDYAVALAHQALDTFSKRYAFTPKGPILVEIFPTHDDFAVRTAGLPGMIGALGVCFGRVVVMDSPRARPPGDFQWEATLWHELAHVITLQMSNYRIPRWLTEGISVYEEKLHRAEWGRGMEMQFASMLNDGETLKLRDLNSAFTDPRKISLAYYQASLLVEHIVATYGDDGLHRLLRAYGQGLDTDAALKSAFDTDFDQMQTAFDQTLDRKFGALRVALKIDKDNDLAKMSPDALQAYAAQHPESYPSQMLLGQALRKAGDFDRAVQAFNRAAAAAPMATGDDSPYEQLADIALERKDTAAAIAALREAMDADFNNVVLARKLAGLMKDSAVTDPARLRPVYERITAVDPFDAEAHATLGRLAIQMNQPEVAIPEFRAVVALKPVDQAAAYTDLAESYFLSGRRADARHQTLAALEIAPSYERAQDLLLKLSESQP
jgi:tetratricopeptide (TPR) repeat protein